MSYTIEPCTDRQTLVELYLGLLTHLARFDPTVTATAETAQWWVDQVFVPAASHGAPVLIARHNDGRAIGGLFWVITPTPGVKHAYGYGTYIVPEWRECGVGTALRSAAVLKLKASGVTHLIGCAHLANEPGQRSLRALDMAPYAMLYHLLL